jgi:hypothetical protein
MKTIAFISGLSGLAIVACGTDVPEPAKDLLPTAATVKIAATTQPTVPGFTFSPQSSAFRVGANAHTVVTPSMTRLVGDEGAIATTANGATLSVANSGAPSLLVPPYSTDASAHTARVLQYFEDSGLPTSQLGDTHITTKVKGGGAATAAEGRPTLVAYTTILDRKIQGIRVEGSYAWARFNSDNVVTAEEVFWPPLPMSVVNEALALTGSLKNASAQATFVSKLPAAVKAGQSQVEVVIHHSPLAVATVAAFASIDVSGPSLPEVYSSNMDGTPVPAPAWWPQPASGSKPVPQVSPSP